MNRYELREIVRDLRIEYPDIELMCSWAPPRGIKNRRYSIQISANRLCFPAKWRPEGVGYWRNIDGARSTKAAEGKVARYARWLKELMKEPLE